LHGQLAHLAGDDAEAEAMLPGARGLDRRVEREQIGLTRDARDAVYELADLARFAVEHARHLGGMVHMHHQVHEQGAGACDFLAAPVRLQGDLGDLSLSLLGARV